MAVQLQLPIQSACAVHLFGYIKLLNICEYFCVFDYIQILFYICCILYLNVYIHIFLIFKTIYSNVCMKICKAIYVCMCLLGYARTPCRPFAS